MLYIVSEYLLSAYQPEIMDMDMWCISSESTLKHSMPIYTNESQN